MTDSLYAKIDSGWAFNREKFSARAVEVFEFAVSYRRAEVKLPEDALKGRRFGNNRTILARLESYYTEAEFMACPGPRIDHALIDAAKSDHWYEFEKDYGMYETEIVDENEDE